MTGQTTKMLEEVVRLQREQGARPFVVMNTYRMVEYAAALLKHLGGDPRLVGWLAASISGIDRRLRGSKEPLFVDHSTRLYGENYDAVDDYRKRRQAS